jgi:hypothetical protein
MSSNGSVPLSARVRARQEQVSCDLGDEAVVLNLEDGAYYGLNEVAARVWKLVQEPRTVAEIRDSLMEVYEVNIDSCTQDLLILIAQLQEWKLIEIEE